MVHNVLKKGFGFAIICFFIFISKEGGFCHMETTKLFYVPFDISTYMAITRDSIEKDAKQSYCVFDLNFSHKKVNWLKEIINKTKTGSFNNYIVRLKIIGLYDDDIYIDQDGGMYRSGKETELTIDGFQELKKFIDKLLKENPKNCQTL